MDNGSRTIPIEAKNGFEFVWKSENENKNENDGHKESVRHRENRKQIVSGNEQHICTNLLNDNHNILCYMQLRDKTHT